MFSPAVSSLRDAFGVPPTKVPASTSTFASYAIPPVACYIVAAVLAVTPQTRAFRVALWPVLALLAFRAAVSVDMSHGDPDRIILNVNLVVCLFRHISPKRNKNLGRQLTKDSSALVVHAYCYSPCPFLGTGQKATRATPPACE